MTMFSIFIPHHRSVGALEPTLRSIAAAARHLETHHPGVRVEVLVGLNGVASGQEVIHAMPSNTALWVINLDLKMNGNVGALKGALCGFAVGEWLVELDSDDYLKPGALTYLLDALRANKDELDFIYSDTARVLGAKPQLFASDCGWQVSAMGAGELYNKTPEMTGINLYSILHAPDHVRAWRRSFYMEIGGHNPALPICDDHDLLIRTYLAGARCYHIEKVLYQYNISETGDNTWLNNVQEIQEESARLGNQNLDSLILQQAERDDLLVLELGGCEGTPGRYTMAITGSDHNCDLRKGIPLEDNSCVAVYCQDFLEHIPSCQSVECKHEAGSCVVGIMEDIHRVLIPGGMLIASTPSTGGYGAHCDPSHVSFWNLLSSRYYTEASQFKFLGHTGGEPTCKFIAHRNYEWYPSDWCKQNNLLYVDFVLGALKPGTMGRSSLR